VDDVDDYGKGNFFQQYDHGPDFRGEKNEYRPKNRSDDNPVVRFSLIMLLCPSGSLFALRAATPIHYIITI